jgi:integrase
VKPFKAVTSSRIRFLSVEDQGRLVQACDTEFRPLVEAALYTGARYGELTRLRVQDFSPKSGTVFIEISKSGKSRHVWLTDEAIAWFTRMTRDRPSEERLLIRKSVKRTSRTGMDDPSAWAPYDQLGPMEQACKNAGIPPLTFHELRHTYASALVNSGVPLVYVAAQLGHADTRMVERYYGHLCPNAQAESIRKLAPKLGISDPMAS